MSAGRTVRVTRTFVLMTLALGFPLVTMTPAGAQCYPPPCGGGGGGGTTTVVAPTTTVVGVTTTTTRPATTTTTAAGATTTTTKVVPIAPTPPDKSVKDVEKPVTSGGKSLLSRTGANIVPLVTLALALTFVGLLLARAARRKTAVAGPTDF